MIEILLVSVLVLIFALLLIMAIIKFSRIERMLKKHDNTSWEYIKKNIRVFYNARKRDENLLRELHKFNNFYELTSQTDFNAITENICCARKEIKECSKKITGIDNVSRENCNNNKELKQLILSTQKSIKEIKPILENSSQSLKSCTKTLGLFEEIIKSSNVKDAETISKRSR